MTRLSVFQRWPVTVSISYGEGTVVRVRDDGVGLSQRGGDGPGLHFAVAGLRARVSEAGGRVEVTAAEPRGAEVTLVLPSDAPFRRPVRT